MRRNWDNQRFKYKTRTAVAVIEGEFDLRIPVQSVPISTFQSCKFDTCVWYDWTWNVIALDYRTQIIKALYLLSTKHIYLKKYVIYCQRRVSWITFIRRVWRYHKGWEKSVNQRTDNSMSKRKWTKGQTTIYKLKHYT